MPIGEETGAHVERRRRDPETLRLRAVMPMFLVSDVERSLTWYRDVMGFVVAEELHRDGALVAVQLKAGKVRFLLEQDAGGASGRRGEGVRLCCATRQDVTRLAAAIQSRGGEVERPPSDHDGARDFTVVDPDGYRISVYWRPSA